MQENNRALALIERNEVLSEIVTVEPEILVILKTAALYSGYANRWHMYTELKQRFLPLVGHYAQKPEIATSRHYEAMISAIDYLLPKESGGNILSEVEE